MPEAWHFIVLGVLLSLSALFSGLTLGIMGLDTRNLELLTQGPFLTKEEEQEAKYVQRILPVRRTGNLLLCVLLLGNVTVNVFISIVMSEI